MKYQPCLPESESCSEVEHLPLADRQRSRCIRSGVTGCHCQQIGLHDGAPLAPENAIHITETEYVITGMTGSFVMPPDQIGQLVAELLVVKHISKLIMRAGEPMVIVRKSSLDTDSVDPVLNILARYGIHASAHNSQRVTRHQCHQAEL